MAWGVMVACIYIGWEVGDYMIDLIWYLSVTIISYMLETLTNSKQICYMTDLIWYLSVTVISYLLGTLTNSKPNPLCRWETTLSIDPTRQWCIGWHHRWCHDDAVIPLGNKEKKSKWMWESTLAWCDVILTGPNNGSLWGEFSCFIIFFLSCF
jgi:hypothetical protein